MNTADKIYSSVHSENVDRSDILTILVASDIHLGFEEYDPIRGQDTFETFEEILKIAVAKEVDFILLGGNLFHHASPSPHCLFKCTELLRRYCFGDRPVEIEFLSDPSHNFRSSYNKPTVNYEDPNLNVSMPIFSIHGNHDNPTGHEQISIMDLMSSAGLINYFGRWNSLDEVEVKPILLQKGETKLALYGLSHIKDERLGRLLLNKKVKWLTLEDQKDWFNLLVCHQNRAIRGVKNFIPDEFVPDFLDLVIWGHEHECRIDLDRKENGPDFSQPGSSVATSLAKGEAIPKKVGILWVHKKDFGVIPIELQTVRPFVFQELVLDELDQLMDEYGCSLTPTEITVDIVTKKVNEMIEEAKKFGRTADVTEKPLIRLNVKVRDERQIFNTIRFGQSYVGKVANPKDMIKCNVIKQPVQECKKEDGIQLSSTPIVPERVEDIVLKYFSENDSLKVFPIGRLIEGVKEFIDSSHTDAFSSKVDQVLKKTKEHLAKKMPEVENTEEVVNNFRISREQESPDSEYKLLNDPNRDHKRNPSKDDEKPKVRQRSYGDDEIMVMDDDYDDSVDTGIQVGLGSG